MNGERRYHRRTPIWYDADNKSWYVRSWDTLENYCGATFTTERRYYFDTIAGAKRFIDQTIKHAEEIGLIIAYPSV